MATLQALPDELLDSILTGLDFRDANKLSMTCKHLRAVALPVAYHSITLEWSNATRQQGKIPKAPQCHKLLRTLIERPEYVKLVKSLDFRATECLSYQDDSIPSSQTNISDEEKKLFEDCFHSLRLPAAKHLEGFLTDGNDRSVYKMLIVAMCTHLESLSIATEFLLQSNWFTMLIWQALSSAASTTEVAWYSQLSSLRITRHTVGDLRRDEIVFLGQKFPLLFCLPRVEKLELTFFINDYLSWDPEDLIDLWPLKEHPKAEKLTTLRLSRSSITASTLGLLLQQTPNLHTFEYDRFQLSYVHFNLLGIRQALQQVRSTLTHLTIGSEFWHEYDPPADNNYDTRGSLGPLNEFSALVSLSIPLAVLFGSEDIDEGRIPKLSFFLPPHLQSLTITDGMWTYHKFRQYYEDVGAMEILKTYLTGEKAADTCRPGTHENRTKDWDEGITYSNIAWVADGEPEWKVATPELREFVYDLRKNRTMGYWQAEQPREELKRGCQSQGIECHVLYQQDK
ncbi:Nn.00g107100.m01.CDS01 [Neocucurbitaria sp. VM-36]